MKKKKIFKALALVLAVVLIYWGYDRWSSQNWREYSSLVKLWPRLQKEKIENIIFCDAINKEAGTFDNETTYQQMVEFFRFRFRDTNDVKSWNWAIEVPKENLPECVKIIDKTMKGARPWWYIWREYIPVWPTSRMLIVTDKGKYIVHVETAISNVARSCVYGEEWKSYELGEFLTKYCIPGHEYKYVIPPKEQTVAILLISNGTALLVSPPVALFGDKKLAEKLIYVDKNEAEKITGRSLEPKMVFEGRVWLEKIMDAYEIALKEAEKREKEKKGSYYPGDIYALNARIVFITRDEFYWKGIGISENTVYDDYIKSDQLKVFFDELGLTKELLAREPNKVPKN